MPASPQGTWVVVSIRSEWHQVEIGWVHLDEQFFAPEKSGIRKAAKFTLNALHAVSAHVCVCVCFAQTRNDTPVQIISPLKQKFIYCFIYCLFRFSGGEVRSFVGNQKKSFCGAPVEDRKKLWFTPLFFVVHLRTPTFEDKFLWHTKILYVHFCLPNCTS